MATTAEKVDVLKIPVHPAADVFPTLSGPEFAQLKTSIERDGQRERLTLWRDPETGDVLLADGRNRRRVCEKLGIVPEYEFFDGDAEEVVRLILSRNIIRRHLERGDAIRATAEMVKLTVSNLETVGDKCKLVAEFGGYPASTVRNFLKPDLTPKSDAELAQEAKAERERKERKEKEKREAERQAETAAEADDEPETEPEQSEPEQSVRESEPDTEAEVVFRFDFHGSYRAKDAETVHAWAKGIKELMTARDGFDVEIGIKPAGA